jgi:alcohol dehydrogenase (quinone), cytochrome c subunit
VVSPAALAVGGLEHDFRARGRLCGAPGSRSRLGRCGACQTPRGLAFQEKALDDSRGTYLQGAELDAWSAPNLRSDLRTGLGAWSLDDIVALLKSGHNDKGVAFGSMLDVVNNSTPYLSDEDTAMAACSPHRLTCASARATLRPLSICESKRGAMASPATLGDDGNCLAAGGCGICLG